LWVINSMIKLVQPNIITAVLVKHCMNGIGLYFYMVYLWNCWIDESTHCLKHEYWEVSTLPFLLGAHFVSSLYRATGVAEGWGRKKTERQLPNQFLGLLIFGGFLCSVCVVMFWPFDCTQFCTRTPFKSSFALSAGWVVSIYLKTITSYFSKIVL
jgi:hypothetical protein